MYVLDPHLLNKGSNGMRSCFVFHGTLFLDRVVLLDRYLPSSINAESHLESLIIRVKF